MRQNTYLIVTLCMVLAGCSASNVQLRAPDMERLDAGEANAVDALMQGADHYVTSGDWPWMRPAVLFEELDCSVYRGKISFKPSLAHCPLCHIRLAAVAALFEDVLAAQGATQLGTQEKLGRLPAIRRRHV